MIIETNLERPVGTMEQLVEVVQQLSLATELGSVVEIVRHAARSLAGADGASFVLRDRDLCHYVDEDAIGPLWRGQRFPIDRCVSGWAMTHSQHVAIEDIYEDPRIPIDAYAPTFVKSLLMVPIRKERPIGAIGVYWAKRHVPTDDEIRLLQALAHSTSVALTNVDLLRDLRGSLAETREARDELERQLHLRDDFISLAAHELRTPLTPLHFQMHLLRDSIERSSSGPSPETAPRLRRAIDSAERQIADLSALAERMLDVSRISMGRLELSFGDPIDLGEATRDAIEAMRRPEGLELTLRLAIGATGRWDEHRIREVVRILVDNAMKFGADHAIDVEVASDDESATLVVRDRGIGIAEANHAAVFERFERAADSSNYRGLGLGLYVARAIVEAHGGSIRIASALGEGTEVTVTLPRNAPRQGR